MNKVILIGHMAGDPALKRTQNGTSVCSFRIGVQRRYVNAQGVKEADFINVTAWRGAAEVVSKYTKKGSKIGIVGSLQVRSYADKEGEMRYVTEVIADEIELLGNKAESAEAPQQESGNFVQVNDDELPF